MFKYVEEIVIKPLASYQYINTIFNLISVLFLGIIIPILALIYLKIRGNFKITIKSKNHFLGVYPDSRNKTVIKKYSIQPFRYMLKIDFMLGIYNNFKYERFVDEIRIYLKDFRKAIKRYSIDLSYIDIGMMQSNGFRKDISYSKFLPYTLFKSLYYDNNSEIEDLDSIKKYILSRLPKELKFKVILFNQGKKLKTKKFSIKLNPNYARNGKTGLPEENHLDFIRKL